MNQPLSSHIGRQWRVVRTDPWLLALVTWVPLVLFLMLWAIFSKGIARDLPIGVVDLDNSRLSRALIRHYDASSSLDAGFTFASVDEGTKALRAASIYALIILPKNLAADTLLGRPPQVHGLFNSQYLLIGKIVNSALMQTHGSFSAGVEVVQGLATANPLPTIALANAVPIGNQVTPLFNTNTNYAQFLVSAMLPAMWQILMIATTVLTLATARRKNEGQWPGDEPRKGFLATVIVLTALFWLQGIWWLTFMYVLLGWPMHGSWTILLFAQFLTSVASVAAAALFFLFSLDVARGLSLAAAYAAPGLAYMGVTFPVTDMTLPARIWRSFLPISHYIEIQFAQVNYGAPILQGLPQIANLCLFALLLILGLLRVGSLIPTSHTVEGKL